MKFIFSSMLSISTILIIIISISSIGVNMNAYGKKPKGIQSVSDTYYPRSKNFKLIAQLKKDLFKPGEPIILKVILKNISKKTHTIVVSGPERDYDIIVKDNKGAIVPLTKYGKRLMDNKGEFRAIGKKIKSQKEIQINLLINRIYDMTISGTYSIKVERFVLEQNRKKFAKVISNTVKIKVAD